MKIDLTDREVYQILKDKFGEASFRLFFFENEAGREKRTGKKLHEDGVAPTNKNTSVYLGEKETIVP